MNDVANSLQSVVKFDAQFATNITHGQSNALPVNWFIT